MLKRSSPDRIIELVFAGVIVLFTIMQYENSKANNESTSYQTDQLIAAAKYNAYAAKQNALASGQFAASADSINTGIDHADDKLSLQAERIEEARESSVDQSQRALNATIANFHQEQRAWVGIAPLDATSINSSITSGNGFGLINTGRTPAQDVRVFFSENSSSRLNNDYVPGPYEAEWMKRIIEAKKSGRLEGIKIIEGKKDPNRPVNFSMPGILFDASLVPPGKLTAYTDPVEMKVIGSMSPGILFPSALGSMLFNGKHNVLIFGQIVYRDVYAETERVTTFCEYSSLKTGYIFSACPVYNSMQ